MTQSHESRLAQLEERTRVVRDSAVHREATVGANREGHRSLAGRRIVGGLRTTRRKDLCVVAQANIKARVLSEPSLLLQITRLGGKAKEGVSLSRYLKRVHSTAPQEQCLRGKTLFVFRGAIRAM
jgi:hypothetical protein